MIRDARRDELADLAAAVVAQPLLSRYEVTAERLTRDLQQAVDRGDPVLVAEEDGRAVGFAWFFPTGTFGIGAYLRLIALIPGLEGRGMGGALVDEMERSYREFGVDFFYLWGDTVTLNVKTFTAFCDELIARNLPIRWFGNARADNLTDPAFVHRLRKAGCWMLAMGIETESEEIRRDMVKKLERQKIQAALNNMRDAGIRSFAFFIFGYPGETLASINQTIEYAIELNPDFANFYPAVPYPGTALYDKVVRDGMLVEEDWGRMEYSYYLLKGNGLDEHVVMDAINRAKRRFFMRPAYISRKLGDVMKLAMTKPAIFRQIAARTIFGAKVPDPPRVQRVQRTPV